MEHPEEGIDGVLHNNEKLRLLNQLNERRLLRLEAENCALRERVRSLTSDDDEHRLKLLLADRERRRMTKFKALINKTITSLKVGLTEFTALDEEVDRGIEELAKKGAMDPDTNFAPRLIRKTSEFNRQLNRIVESPLMGTTLLNESEHPRCSNINGVASEVTKSKVLNISEEDGEVREEHLTEDPPQINLTYVLSKPTEENEKVADTNATYNILETSHKESTAKSNSLATIGQTSSLIATNSDAEGANQKNNELHLTLSSHFFDNMQCPRYTSTPKHAQILSQKQPSFTPNQGQILPQKQSSPSKPQKLPPPSKPQKELSPFKPQKLPPPSKPQKELSPFKPQKQPSPSKPTITMDRPRRAAAAKVTSYADQVGGVFQKVTRRRKISTLNTEAGALASSGSSLATRKKKK